MMRRRTELTGIACTSRVIVSLSVTLLRREGSSSKSGRSRSSSSNSSSTTVTSALATRNSVARHCGTLTRLSTNLAARQMSMPESEWLSVILTCMRYPAAGRACLRDLSCLSTTFVCPLRSRDEGDRFHKQNVLLFSLLTPLSRHIIGKVVETRIQHLQLPDHRMIFFFF